MRNISKTTNTTTATVPAPTTTGRLRSPSPTIMAQQEAQHSPFLVDETEVWRSMWEEGSRSTSRGRFMEGRNTSTSPPPAQQRHALVTRDAGSTRAVAKDEDDPWSAPWPETSDWPSAYDDDSDQIDTTNAGKGGGGHDDDDGWNPSRLTTATITTQPPTAPVSNNWIPNKRAPTPTNGATPKHANTMINAKNNNTSDKTLWTVDDDTVMYRFTNAPLGSMDHPIPVEDIIHEQQQQQQQQQHSNQRHDHRRQQDAEEETLSTREREIRDARKRDGKQSTAVATGSAAAASTITSSSSSNGSYSRSGKSDTKQKERKGIMRFFGGGVSRGGKNVSEKDNRRKSFDNPRVQTGAVKKDSTGLTGRKSLDSAAPVKMMQDSRANPGNSPIDQKASYRIDEIGEALRKPIIPSGLQQHQHVGYELRKPSSDTPTTQLLSNITQAQQSQTSKPLSPSESTVSEVTNPTFTSDGKAGRKSVPSLVDPFDVRSSFFVPGQDPFLASTVKPIEKSVLSSSSPQHAFPSPDFGDPFFADPALDSVDMEDDGDIAAHDPELDHLNLLHQDNTASDEEDDDEKEDLPKGIIIDVEHDQQKQRSLRPLTVRQPSPQPNQNNLSDGIASNKPYQPKPAQKSSQSIPNRKLRQSTDFPVIEAKSDFPSADLPVNSTSKERPSDEQKSAPASTRASRVLSSLPRRRLTATPPPSATSSPPAQLSKSDGAYNAVPSDPVGRKFSNNPSRRLGNSVLTQTNGGGIGKETHLPNLPPTVNRVTSNSPFGKNVVSALDVNRKPSNAIIPAVRGEINAKQPSPAGKGLTSNNPKISSAVPPQIESLGTAPSSDESLTLHAKNTNESSSLSSVGSDIRRLRSILRRSRGNHLSGIGRNSEALASITSSDEASHDPMHRAGLRLLSAAVIPIQCVARRYLALREALTRMWAIVIIQALARRWIVITDLRKKRQAATRIQSLYRGGIVRDQVLLEQCCAIEIQRHVRGLLATLEVYEKIYKITRIQCTIRRFLAMNEAMDRMVSIIQIQSVARAYLVRQQTERLKLSAIKIQACYRAFHARFTYQLDLLDIIIVQSAWRRRKAACILEEKRHHRCNQAALIIQTQWRCYDCTMNYLHFLADVLITQSAARRWFARREASELRATYTIRLQSFARMCLAKVQLRRMLAAVAIQRTWRGFVCYADYMFTIADIVIVQSLARKKLAVTKLAHMKDLQKVDSATKIQRLVRRAQQKNLVSAVTIQRYWRGFVCETEFFIMKYEHRAATLIQAWWRRFWHFSNFIITLDSTITIQTIYRGYRARRSLDSGLKNVRVIQKAIRGYIHRSRNRVASYMESLILSAETSAAMESNCAIQLQSIYRGSKARDLAVGHRSARLLQTYWRCFSARRFFTRFLAARRIQSLWRGASSRINTATRAATLASVRREFEQSHSSLKIQTFWRGRNNRRKFVTFIAARTLQSFWRGYVDRLAYVHYVCARRIQTRWRVCLASWPYQDYIAARKIQSVVRARLCRTVYISFKAARKIQSVVRARLCRTVYIRYKAARSIQSVVRGRYCRMAYVDYIAARTIQSAFRMFSCRKAYIRYNAAKSIQSIVRGRNCRNVYMRYTAARSIQSHYRRVRAMSEYKKVLAAKVIQRRYRGFVCRVSFRKFVSARLIQSLYRGYATRSRYRKYTAARMIQKNWRGFVVLWSYKYYVSARKIQKCWRGHIVRSYLKLYLASRLIQSVWRGHIAREVVEKHKAARGIQTAWRGYYLRRIFDEFKAARVIQSTWRGHLVRLSVRQYKAACRVQTTWRRFYHRQWFVEYTSCRLIQALWRGYIVRTSLCQFKSCRLIQSMWRGHLVRISLIQYKAVRLMQTHVRGWIARQAFKKRLMNIFFYEWSMRQSQHEYDSARSVQRVFRGWIKRQTYKEYKSAKAIQCSYRGWRVRWAYKQYRGAVLLQARIRGLLTRASIRAYLMARIIQRVWRGHVARSAFGKHLSARRIQNVWRQKLARTCLFKLRVCETDRTIHSAVTSQSHKEDRAARKIQLMVRCRVHRNKFRSKLAAVRIQTQWRGYVQRSSYEDYLLVRLIQNVWRRKLCRVKFLKLRARLMHKTIDAAIVVQRIYRGYTVRKCHPTFTSWSMKSSRAYIAAVNIQKIVRGCAARLSYWEQLGSVIELQRMIRGWQARSLVERFQSVRKIQALVRGVLIREQFRSMGAAIQIQCCYRGYVARRTFGDWVSAAIVVQTITRGFLTRKAACVSRRSASFAISGVETNPLSGSLREKAASTIQRFFLYVKAEVDREIRIEKKRRRARKKKRRTSAEDDDILENIWHRTVSQSSFGEGSDKIRLAEQAVAKALTKQASQSLYGENYHDHYTESINHKDSRIKQIPKSLTHFSIPPEYRDETRDLPPHLPIHSITVGDEDRISDVSSSIYRIPPPRSLSLSRNDINDDLCLEEAWIDAAIRSTRQRRDVERRNARRLKAPSLVSGYR